MRDTEQNHKYIFTFNTDFCVVRVPCYSPVFSLTVHSLLYYILFTETRPNDCATMTYDNVDLADLTLKYS